MCWALTMWDAILGIGDTARKEISALPVAYEYLVGENCKQTNLLYRMLYGNQNNGVLGWDEV